MAEKKPDFNLELRQIVKELNEDPVHKFNIAFSLMSIIPILGFVYILVGQLFSFKILEGNIGFIVFGAILISLLGFCLGHILIKNLLSRVISYMIKLKENDHQKSIFVANVSHEIKNPLSALVLAISNILDGIAGSINEYQDEILKRCKNLCERLIRFATDMLDISKIEAGKIELKRSLIELNKLLEDEIKIFEPISHKKNIHLAALHVFPKIEIWADRDKLAQAVFNLIDNAIKYTPKNGKVLINLGEENRHVRVEISDTGPGIPPDKIDKVFDKFERVSSDHEGTGLGLPIAKDIIELHRGRIWIESKLNEGSKCIILLPRDLRIARK